MLEFGLGLGKMVEVLISAVPICRCSRRLLFPFDPVPVLPGPVCKADTAAAAAALALGRSAARCFKQHFNKVKFNRIARLKTAKKSPKYENLENQKDKVHLAHRGLSINC